MRTLFLSLAYLCLSLSISVAQPAYLQDYLKYKISKSSNELIPVIIKNKEQVDIQSLKELLLLQKISLEERRKIIVNELYSKNNKVNKLDLALFELQKQFPNEVQSVQKFWAVNALSCKLSKRLIYGLLKRGDIEYIQYDSKVEGEKAKIAGPVLPARSIGGAEQGLLVCKARFMWNLGYTGRNRIAMNIDTGVNADHPSLGDRFLGHYLPLSQTWFGYEHDYPFDIDQSHFHGTHTLGTMIGLDKAHSDTIGFAFNSYWISSDPVVTSPENIRTESEYFRAFQWALNPDGDLSTSTDIPEVINNSWGVAHETWPDCNIIEVDFLVALEAADCAVVFSAGNEGPNPQTTGMPAGIIRDTLNIFSVGALNAANSEFPIANFSSRGPSHCDPTSSLGIKPEVSAPGVNVRSASGGDTYLSLSGTSMAGPHVSGAILLLREAFPNATSTELKNALYQSATDLGEVGEDNVYGRGLINLEAAYNFLAESYTPSTPITNDYNLEVNFLTGNTTYSDVDNSPYTFSVKNTGISAIDNFTYTVKVNGTSIQEQVHADALNPGDSVLLSFNADLQKGFNDISVAVKKEGLEEFNIFDNSRRVRTFLLVSNELPYTENFDTARSDFSNANMFLINPDKQKTWSIDSTKGLTDNKKSLKMDFLLYGNNIGVKGQKDYVILGRFDIPEEHETLLSFVYSYARFFNSSKDSLKIKVGSTLDPDEGQWIYGKGGAALATHSNVEGVYTPADTADWAKEEVSLTDFAGQTIYLKLTAVNRGGNNLFIDNIKVENGEGLKVSELNHSILTLKVFPNPASKTIHIEGLGAKSEWSIINANGALIQKGHTPISYLDVSRLNPGLYVLKTSLNQTAKFVIQR